MSGILGHAGVTGSPQPTQDRQHELCGAFDGELYNNRQVNDELARLGFGSHTRSDAETVLDAYAAWGEDCVHHFNGMFAFVIHDQRQHRLFGARDHLGHKPLYYMCGHNIFRFAGDPVSLLKHSNTQRELDPEALARYLVFGCVPAPMTIYRGIRKLPRAHRFRFDLDTGRFAVEPYWELPAPASADVGHKQRIRAALDVAVDRRLDRDGPCGVLLSGSAEDTALADAAARRVGADHVLTFSMDHSDAGADLSETLADMEAHLDEPLADSTILPIWTLARRAARTVNVALWGAPVAGIGHRQHRPDQLIGLLTPEVLGQIDPDAVLSQVRWLNRSMIERDPAVRDAHLQARTSLADGLLAAVNRASKACSLQIRCPLLDVDFVELVAPRFWRARRGSTEPMDAWLRNELREPLLAALDDRIIREQALFRPDAVQRLLDEHLSGRRDHRGPLFALLVFQRWHRRWMEHAEVTPAPAIAA